MTPQLVDHAHTNSCIVIGCNLVHARGWLVGVEFNAPNTPNRHNIGHFGGGLHSQSLD